MPCSTALCTICLEPRAFPEQMRFFLECGHGFCTQCLACTSTKACPACRAPNEGGPPRRIFVEFVKGDASHAEDDEHTTTEVLSEADALKYDDVAVDASTDDLDTVAAQLSTLVGAPRLDRDTKSRILHALSTLEEELRPALLALRAERADNALLLADIDALHDALDGARGRVRGLERERIEWERERSELESKHLDMTHEQIHVARERRAIEKERGSLMAIVAGAMRELRASGKRERLYGEEIELLREEGAMLRAEVEERDAQISTLQRTLADKAAKATRRGRRAAGLKRLVAALKQDYAALRQSVADSGVEDCEDEAEESFLSMRFVVLDAYLKSN
ncbi:hypothetical protein HDZ31DRAFT_63215 [Schizophyllum fasciatum]